MGETPPTREGATGDDHVIVRRVLERLERIAAALERAADIAEDGGMGGFP
jgi:hypothetical protein